MTGDRVASQRVRIEPGVADGMAAAVAAALRGKADAGAVPVSYLFRVAAEAFGEILAAATVSPANSAVVLESLLISLPHALEVNDELEIDQQLQAGSSGALLRLKAHSPARGEVAELEARTLAVTADRLRAPRQAAGTPADRRPAGSQIGSMLVTPELAARYADLSADRNPLHLDAAYAAALGLPERIVHGTFLAAIAGAAVASAAGGGRVTRLSMRFLAPVFVAAPVAVALQELPPSGFGLRRWRASFTRDDGMLACIADVSLSGDR